MCVLVMLPQQQSGIGKCVSACSNILEFRADSLPNRYIPYFLEYKSDFNQIYTVDVKRVGHYH